MPILEYRCQSCNHTFEELVPVSQREAVRCPQCGQAVKRIYEGKCHFGMLSKSSSPSSSSCGCTKGSCSGCSGCTCH